MSNISELSQAQKKHFKSIGHKLNPIVTVGDAGLGENVQKELDRALEDHELIKVKIPAGDKSLKQQLLKDICAHQNCALVQQIGNIALLYRAARKPSPRLSNLLKQRD